MDSKKEILDRLTSLDREQFRQLVFYLKIPTAELPEDVSQVEKAIEVYSRLEQEQGGLERLERALADRAISIIGDRYIGCEIEAQVKQIVGDYTQQPFAGREEEKHKLDEFLKNNSSGVLLVTGAAGFGKSSLLSHWQKAQQEDCFIAYHCFSYRYEKTRSVSEAYRHLLKQLYYYHNIRNGEFPNDENQMRDLIVGMLHHPVSPESKHLAIVLDGLDEAEKTFEPFFLSLPTGVFVIASARAEEGEKPEYLRNWRDNAQGLQLTRLSREAIAKWLEQISELATYSQDDYFVNRLDETTDGFPLYLRYLIEDLRKAVADHQDVYAVLKDCPTGFKDYVKEQFRQLAKVEEIERQREVQELFAVLSVALGALSQNDIENLTSLTAWNLADLPWQATRWFCIQTDLYSFAHPLLAHEFQGVLGRQASSAKGKLIEYCAKWQEHCSAYALRHYAEHLSEAKQWEELYQLARNENFAFTQQKHLADDPDLPLKTVQTALLGAAEEDKAEGMAEFLLLHAHRVVQMKTTASPLNALREGNLKGAWKLADRLEIERRILWYMLLVWELKDEGRQNDARETLQRLPQKDLPCFQLNWNTDWQCNYAAYLLAQIFEVNEEICLELNRKLFDDNPRLRLCYCLIDRGQIRSALKIAEEMILQQNKAFPLSTILIAQAAKVNSQETKLVYEKVHKITRQFFQSWNWLWWINYVVDVAKAQIKVGMIEEARATFNEAIEAAYQIEKINNRTTALINISKYQTETGLFDDARKTLERIDLDIQCNLIDSDSCLFLASVQAQMGDTEQARISFCRAKQLAQDSEEKNNLGYNFSQIARVQSQVGQFADALDTIEELAACQPYYLSFLAIESALLSVVNDAKCNKEEFVAVLDTANRISKKIEEPYFQEQLFKIIVEIQVRKALQFKEGFSDALETTALITEQRTQSEALLKIIKAQTQVGEFEAAIATTERIKIPEDKDRALITILRSQANSRRFEAAFQTGSDIQKQNTQEDAVVEIAKAYAKAQNFSNALKIGERLFNPFKKVELFKSIATRQQLVGLAKEARETFARGLNVSFSSEVSSLQAFALLNIAKSLLGVGNKEKCLTYAKKIRKLSETLNKLDDKVDLLAELGKMYAKADLANEAKDIFSQAIAKLQHFQEQDSPTQDVSLIKMLIKIAIAQASSRMFKDALETVNKIRNNAARGKSQFLVYQALVLKTLAQSSQNTEDKEKIKIEITNLYDNASSAYDTTFDVMLNGHPATVFSCLAVAHMELGETEAALALFAEASQLVEEETLQKVKTSPDSLLSTVAQSWAEAGYFEKALENVEKIDDGGEQIEALSKIAFFQYNKGAKEQLTRTLDMALTAKDNMTDRHQQLLALLAIAQIEIIAGKIEKGFRTAEPVLTNCPQLSYHLAATLAKVKDKDYFKKLLILCAYSFDTAYAMCSYIASLYPEKLDDIARKVNDSVFN